MLLALLDGRSLPATALAWAAGVSSQVGQQPSCKTDRRRAAHGDHTGAPSILSPGRPGSGPCAGIAGRAGAAPRACWNASTPPRPAACVPRDRATTIWRDSSVSRWPMRWRTAGLITASGPERYMLSEAGYECLASLGWKLLLLVLGRRGMPGPAWTGRSAGSHLAGSCQRGYSTGCWNWLGFNAAPKAAPSS